MIHPTSLFFLILILKFCWTFLLCLMHLLYEWDIYFIVREVWTLTFQNRCLVIFIVFPFLWTCQSLSLILVSRVWILWIMSMKCRLKFNGKHLLWVSKIALNQIKALNASNWNIELRKWIFWERTSKITNK